ncbi:MAG: carbamoyl phosphate synthase large subunit [Candidatus Marinimicrobia bacterium]|nr:carbamoyl phosphate synthase large subunit [Candidatus Neomarinimicrobiota bacterium]
MPKRTDIDSILIIGAGPIIIGQACEFDYSGTQACKALKQEGYRVILVNSNPATIMTDKNLADSTYLEPITFNSLKEIIKKERPNAILPTVGGQTGLDAAIKLYKKGTLSKYKVELIGANVEAIESAENRELFKEKMNAANIPTAKGSFVNSYKEALKKIERIGFPVIIRPSFTMGGTGGSIAYNAEDFKELVHKGLTASPINEILIEQSLIGWKEFEMEVIRDSANNAIIVCSIENIDPMGVHTGDSITVAPIQTLSDKEYQKMRNYSIRCLKQIGVDTGGSNVQFAVNPKTGKMIIIEMNPRVSRSSALASKATGFPIAKIAAKLAIGYRLDEIKNEITGETFVAFEPSIDYIVTKIPRFDFEKFPAADGILGVQMQSVGEVMSIGRTFRESLQKAFRSLEVGLNGLHPKKPEHRSLDISKIRFATSFRLLKIKQAFDMGAEVDEVHEQTKIDPWFLNHIKIISKLYKQFNINNIDRIKYLKNNGFSDNQIGGLTNTNTTKVRSIRKKNNIIPTYKTVDTCAAEFEAKTPYCYSSYEAENEIVPLDGKKIIILGGGPNRIGQGIEFDYCCVQASLGLKEIGYKTIMINCNPETVSTDFDISDRLYFEPLTFEDVMNIIDLEKPDGVLVQFGGQTPLNIAQKLKKEGVTILGTDPDKIDIAEDRKKFGKILKELNIAAPDFGSANSIKSALKIANNIGYPVLVRPSYVLGGRGMKIVYNDSALIDFIKKASDISGKHPILIDRFLENAFEFDVDALSDGNDVVIGGIMQHIEEAGVHSGDSSCVIPAYSLTSDLRKKIKLYTKNLALKLNIKGLINIQFAIKNNTVYTLEVNPRSSRTIPFISKVTDVPLAKYAAQISVGKKIDLLRIKKVSRKLVAVKKPVFPFNKFPQQNIFLSPEMKSTGEAIGFDNKLGSAFAKAEFSAGSNLPTKGTVFISVNDSDKMKAISIARDFEDLGFEIVATKGTSTILNNNGVFSKNIFKVGEDRPNIVDELKNNAICLIVNTPFGGSAREDEYEIGRAAIRYKVPVFTTISGAKVAVRAIQTIKLNKFKYRSLQEIFN